MGVSTSAGELAGKFQALGLGFARSQQTALNATGLYGKQLFLDELRRKGVSGSTKVSRAVKARYDVKSDSVTIRYTGPAHLLDRRTKAHPIGAKRLGTRSQIRKAVDAGSSFGSLRATERYSKTAGGMVSRSGKAALRLPDGNFRSVVHHPGTKGLGFFKEAKRRGYKELPKAYGRFGLTEPLKAAFK